MSSYSRFAAIISLSLLLAPDAGGGVVAARAFPGTALAPPDRETVAADRQSAAATGKTEVTTERTEAETDAGRGYSLFLPSSYVESRKWPVLFCFDPGRRGTIPVDLFRDSAERLGMIIVSADDFSSSGSTESAIATMTALWNDAFARFSVDPDRVYAAGFSGGGRLCWLLGMNAAQTRLAGIIEVGAGLPWRELPADFDASEFAFYGFAGETDFNYGEVQRLAGILRARGIPERVVSFEGSHEWPSAENCGAALEWLQIEAMKKNRLPVDAALVERVYRRGLSAGAEDEKNTRFIDARDEYLALTETFVGLRDITDAQAGLARLQGSTGLAEQIASREAEARAAAGDLDRAVAALDDMVQSANAPLLPSSKALAKEVQIDSLLQKSRSANRERQTAAKRVLEGVFVRSGVYIPRELMKRGEYAAAVVSLELATMIRPERADAWHRLAQAYSRVGRKTDALAALGKAVDLGYSDLESLRTDSHLDSLRTEPGFQKILKQIKP